MIGGMRYRARCVFAACKEFATHRFLGVVEGRPVWLTNSAGLQVVTCASDALEAIQRLASMPGAPSRIKAVPLKDRRITIMIDDEPGQPVGQPGLPPATADPHEHPVDTAGEEQPLPYSGAGSPDSGDALAEATEERPPTPVDPGAEDDVGPADGVPSAMDED